LSAYLDSTESSLANIASPEADVARLISELDQANLEFGIMDVGRQEAYEALDMEFTSAAADMAKRRPLEEENLRLMADLASARLEVARILPLEGTLSALEAELDEAHQEYGLMDLDRQEAFDDLDMQHTSTAATLARINQLEESASGLTADLEEAHIQLEEILPLEQQVLYLTASLNKANKDLKEIVPLEQQVQQLNAQLDEANSDLRDEQSARREATEMFKEDILHITNASLAVSIRKDNENIAADREAKSKFDDMRKERDDMKAANKLLSEEINVLKETNQNLFRDKERLSDEMEKRNTEIQTLEEAKAAAEQRAVEFRDKSDRLVNEAEELETAIARERSPERKALRDTRSANNALTVTLATLVTDRSQLRSRIQKIYAHFEGSVEQSRVYTGRLRLMYAKILIFCNDGFGLPPLALGPALATIEDDVKDPSLNSLRIGDFAGILRVMEAEFEWAKTKIMELCDDIKKVADHSDGLQTRIEEKEANIDGLRTRIEEKEANIVRLETRDRHTLLAVAGIIATDGKRSIKARSPVLARNSPDRALGTQRALPP
jgi:chromosome segregation ATPase